MKRALILTTSLLLGLAAQPFELPAREANPGIQQMVDQLRQLTEKARQQRAADRWLLNAMEELVARYDWPWREQLLDEAFSDGDFRKDPAWVVRSGEFWIDGKLGLRSRTRPAQRQQSETGPQQPREQDLGRALLGAFLEQALKERRKQQQARPQPGSVPREDEPAEIQLPLDIPTVFNLGATISLHSRPSVESRFELGLFQDPGGRSGYRLVITSGKQSTLELFGHNSGRSFIIERQQIDSLNDGNSHDLTWRRGPNGRMEILIDEQPVSQQRDNSFRYPFKRLALINRSGDLAVESITLEGGQ